MSKHGLAGLIDSYDLNRKKVEKILKAGV
jgi:hypothetical protein